MSPFHGGSTRPLTSSPLFTLFRKNKEERENFAPPSPTPAGRALTLALVGEVFEHPRVSAAVRKMAARSSAVLATPYP